MGGALLEGALASGPIFAGVQIIEPAPLPERLKTLSNIHWVPALDKADAAFVPDLIVLAVVVYLWGAATNLFKGEKGYENLRKQLLWGVFVLFLAVSIWGVVQLLQNSVFGQGVDATNGTGGGSSGGKCTSINCASPFGN